MDFSLEDLQYAELVVDTTINKPPDLIGGDGKLKKRLSRKWLATIAKDIIPDVAGISRAFTLCGKTELKKKYYIKNRDWHDVASRIMVEALLAVLDHVIQGDIFISYQGARIMVRGMEKMSLQSKIADGTINPKYLTDTADMPIIVYEIDGRPRWRARHIIVPDKIRRKMVENINSGKFVLRVPTLVELDTIWRHEKKTRANNKTSGNNGGITREVSGDSG